MEDFKGKTIQGIQWGFLNQIVIQVFGLLITVVLMRLLSPDDFGIIGMAMVFVGFAKIFIDLGFGAAIIHNKKITYLHLTSIFWINILIGFLLTLVFILIAPLIAQFYNEPILTPIVRVVSLIFVLGALGTVHEVYSRKQLDFKTLFFVNFTGQIVAGIVAIIAAYNGFGVWSIVLQVILSTLLKDIVLWIKVKWTPSFSFSISAIKDLLSFSAYSLADTSLNYWVRNIDNLLIGKLFGNQPLGVYSKAYSILTLPIRQISGVVGRVLFPAFSQIQNNPAKVKSVYLRVTKVVSLATFPLMLFVFATADIAVPLIFGPNWLEMVPIIKIFSFLGMNQSIGTLISTIYLSQGRADKMFKVGAGLKLLLILGIIIGLQWGIVGVALGYTIAGYVSSIIHHYFAGKLINLKLLELLGNFKSVLVASVVMLCGVVLIREYGILHLSLLSSFSVLVVSALIIYGTIIHFFKVDAYIDLKQILLERYFQNKNVT